MWNENFDEKQDVVLDNEHTFRVYFSHRDKDNKKPLIVLLHGGGYSALTWAHFTVCFFFKVCSFDIIDINSMLLLFLIFFGRLNS